MLQYIRTRFSLVLATFKVAFVSTTMSPLHVGGLKDGEDFPGSGGGEVGEGGGGGGGGCGGERKSTRLASQTSRKTEEKHNRDALVIEEAFTSRPGGRPGVPIPVESSSSSPSSVRAV